MIEFLKKKSSDDTFETEEIRNQIEKISSDWNYTYNYGTKDVSSKDASQSICDFLENQASSVREAEIYGEDVFMNNFDTYFIYDYLDMFFLTIRHIGERIFSIEDVSKGIDLLDEHPSYFKINKELMKKNWSHLISLL
jgi:hypothetical protein